MRTHSLKAVLSSLIAGASTMTFAASDDSLTIYSSAQPGAIPAYLYRPVAGQRHNPGNVPGYAMVRHDRTYRIDQGVSELRVTDVAALIDPTTVTFSSLSEDSTRVLEQDFQFDLVDTQKLLQRYVGQKIVVEQFHGDSVERIDGTLLGATGGLILQRSDGSVQTLQAYNNVRFPELPGGLMTKPTLVWKLASEQAGEQQTRLSYQTEGMTWWADYNVVYSEERDCRMDINAWVSIINQSGAAYQNAKLKLIAGEVNRAEPPRASRGRMVASMAKEDMAAGFSEKSFFEYHLYTLGRRTDLPNNSTKQLELFPAVNGVKCKKELVFAPTRHFSYYGHAQTDQNYGRGTQGDINVYLRFKNDAAGGMGMPLPAGRIRINQLDTADGSLEFIGEDTIDHTPKNEQVLIKVGNAFDVVGERKQTNFRVDTRARQLWESFEISLRNHKAEKVEVVVLENLFRAANWKIESNTHSFSKENAHQIQFNVNLPANGEVKLEYTVHYDW